MAAHAGLPPEALTLFASGDAQPSAALDCLFRLVARDPERMLALLDGGEATADSPLKPSHQPPPVVATPPEPEPPPPQFQTDEAAAAIALVRASVRKQLGALEFISAMGGLALPKTQDGQDSPWPAALARVTSLVSASEQLAETWGVFEQHLRALQKAGTRRPEPQAPPRPSPNQAAPKPSKHLRGTSVLAPEQAQGLRQLHHTMKEKGFLVNADLRRIFGFNLSKASYEFQRLEDLGFIERNGVGQFTTYTKGPKYHEIFGSPVY